MYKKIIQTEYTLYTTPKYLYWFRVILGLIIQKKIQSETWMSETWTGGWPGLTHPLP